MHLDEYRFKMKRILITGGLGFIGSALARALLASIDCEVVLVDNLLTGDLNNLPNHARCSFIKCDVNRFQDISAVMASGRFDYVFHYAAVVGVQRTLANPALVLEDLDGIRNIFCLSKNTGTKKIFFSSSSEVYGEPVHIPQHEINTPLNARLPYAVVKNVGESYCRSFQYEYNLDYVIFRFFNTYGPSQSEDFVMSKFLRAALKNQDISIYGDGSQSRTFCYIADNIDATLAALLNDNTRNTVFNIGSDEVISILDLARLIIRLTGSSSKICHLPPLPDGDMSRRQPDISRMRQLISRPLLPLEEGVRQILRAWA